MHASPDVLPDAGLAWMRAMRRGDWDAAWRLSDAALAARGGRRDWSAPRHLQPVWDGTALAGRRVLVSCYHGLGDTIQFARFLPAVQAVAAEVTLWSQAPLIPLLATLRDPPRLLPLHDGTPAGEWDAEAEIMELPHILRVSAATLPARVPYLHPPQAERPAGPGLQVGLAWQAGDWAPHRSIPPTLLRPLARLPGVTLNILQRGPALAAMPPGLGIVAGSDDPLVAASRIAALDLVISADSMPAHLAGALGRPVWTLLAADADWRWMEDRDDSPWYPTMRLFRQTAAGDWEGVVRRVAEALRKAAT